MKNFRKIIGVLIATNIATIGYALYLRNKDLRFVNPYPLIDISRNFIPQEDFIVNLQPLREELYRLVETEKDFKVSLYFEFLNTGANISINPNFRIWPASLLKLPMAMAVMKKVERGEWALDKELPLLEGDRDRTYGDLWRRPAGTRLTIEKLLQEMLGNSDNTAYQIFARNIDLKDLFAVLTDIGIEELFDGKGFMSAKEYSRLFRALYTSSFLKRQDSQFLLSLLAQSKFKGFLASEIPEEIPFARKFGINSNHNASLDSGIVYLPNRPYLITVAIQGVGKDSEEADVKRLMKTIAEKTYEYVRAK